MFPAVNDDTAAVDEPPPRAMLFKIMWSTSAGGNEQEKGNNGHSKENPSDRSNNPWKERPEAWPIVVAILARKPNSIAKKTEVICAENATCCIIHAFIVKFRTSCVIYLLTKEGELRQCR